MSRMTFREGLICTIALIAAASAVWGWYHPTVTQGETQYVEVEVPKPYKVISKVTVTVTEIKVIEKEKVVEKEKWPAWFTGDPNQQLTAVGLIEPYRGQTECASVINTMTGDSRIVTKRLPVPLFGFENTKRIGVVIGSGFMVHGSWDFARVGNWHVSADGAFASNMGKSAAVAGVGGTYEW